MIIPLWIIAIIEVVRATQNFVQIASIRKDAKARDNAYAEFIDSLKLTDREWVRRMLEEYEKGEQDAT